MNDELAYVLETYQTVISKHIGSEIGVSFFADSESYVDSIEAIKEPMTSYSSMNEHGISYGSKVVFFQDFSVGRDVVLTDCNVCKIDGLTFIKIITPFTRDRSYDFILTKADETEKVLKALDERKQKSENIVIDFPVIGLDFTEIKKQTIDFLLDEKLREFCRTKHIKLKRGIVFEGHPGCLSGDTIIKVRKERKKGAVAYRLDEAYAKFNRVKNTTFSDNRALWNPSISKHIQSMVNGRLEYREISAIIDSGIKDVWLISTESGKQIKATNNHPFKVLEGTENGRNILDMDGFVALENLVVGDKVYCKSDDVVLMHKNKRQTRKEISGLKYHPNAHDHLVSNIVYKRFPYAKLLVEADMNGISIEEFIDALKTNPSMSATFRYIEKGFVVHHKDWNAKNDTLDNLVVITKLEHDRIHGLNSYFGDTNVVAEKIMSIQHIGQEHVYDITMKDDDSRNFIANGIIVHNCGKSLTLRYLKAEAQKAGIEFKQFDNPKEFLEERGEYYRKDKKHIFVFEDFDALLREREDTNNSPNTILGTVLNTLDGIDEVSDVVSIFTTNQVQLFDSAFIRPGRIDKVMSFTDPTKEQMHTFLGAYIPEYTEFFKDMEAELYEKVGKVSYAILKGICDDINIYQFNKGTLNKIEVIKIVQEKITGANKGTETKDTKSYVL